MLSRSFRALSLVAAMIMHEFISKVCCPFDLRRPKALLAADSVVAKT